MEDKIISTYNNSSYSIKEPFYYHFLATQCAVGFLDFHLSLQAQPLIHPDFGSLDISPV